MATINKTANIYRLECQGNRESRGKNIYTLLVGITGKATLETGVQSPQKLKMELSYDPAILSLSLCTEDSFVNSPQG